MEDSTAKELSDVIENAIHQVLSHLEGYEEGDVLGDWILVCHTSNPEDTRTDAYPMFYANGTMASYRADGLLLKGMTRHFVLDV